MNQKPKIGLVGYFGWGNFGDELFIEAHKQFLGDLYDLEVVHDLLEQPYFSSNAIKRIETYDGFLIGGGDLVNPNAVSPLYWRKEYLNKPVFVHGIGCPNRSVKQSPAIAYFKNFFRSNSIKHICLRDIESKLYFDETIGSSVETVTYPDSVFGMSLPAIQKDKSQKILGVVLRSHASLIGEYEEVRKAVTEAKELGYTVKIIVAAFGKLGEHDLLVSKRFAQPDEEIIYSENLMELCKSFGQCDLILSMKFHTLVVGTMYGVPVIQLSSTQKNRNLFRYLQRPDLLGNYQDKNLWRQIPSIPAPIHSIIASKAKRDSKAGYAALLKKMNEVFSR